MSRAVTRVAVVGAGPAPWLAAAVLAGSLAGSGVAITVITIPGVPTAVATLPPLAGLHRRIGVDSDRLVRAAGAYSLGVQFVGFGGNDFFVPFGGHGPAIGDAPFAALYSRARDAGLRVAFEDFSLNAAAAKQGRFFVADAASTAYALCDHGFHLHGAAYVAALEAVTRRAGAAVVAGTPVVAERDAAGLVARLVLDTGAVIETDVVITCTDLPALSDTWTRWPIPFDRRLIAVGAALDRLPAFGRSVATARGVADILPLVDATAVDYRFAGADDAALAEATAAAGMRLRVVARDALAPGRRANSWVGNVIAIGEAVVRLDGVATPVLHMVQLALALLVTLFPRDAGEQAGAREFNRRTALAADRLCDFHLAPLCLNRRAEPIWAALRTGELPTLLRDKLDLFAANGEVALASDETFLHDSWQAVCFGSGMVPARTTPLADRLRDAELAAELQRRLRFIREQVGAMPEHRAWLTPPR
ncbi:MAG: tryptophan 7-halogenase [Sphingomonadaceae bacterium]|nr:tryptophan 7-halogenase [Sphingomonadaceae bacterium]